MSSLFGDLSPFEIFAGLLALVLASPLAVVAYRSLRRAKVTLELKPRISILAFDLHHGVPTGIGIEGVASNHGSRQTAVTSLAATVVDPSEQVHTYVCRHEGDSTTLPIAVGGDSAESFRATLRRESVEEDHFWVDQGSYVITVRAKYETRPGRGAEATRELLLDLDDISATLAGQNAIPYEVDVS